MATTRRNQTAVSAQSQTAAQPGPAEPVIPVGEGEEPWTTAELAEQRAELVAEVSRMERAIEVARAELAQLLRDGPDGAGRDPADVGSSNFECDQEMSLAQNALEMLEQSQLALRLFDARQYGTCESCGEPIGKLRLQAFPRATMCVRCKQREERR